MHLSIKGFLKRKKMEKVAAMKSDAPLCLDDGERSRQTCGDLPQMTLADGESADLLQCQEDSVNSSALKYRRYGSSLSGVKVRHKRQVLQNMARPLKHWLYKHRDNPYPTKTEKVLLALGSHMTLVQVSNWFANARRRLKNTVRQPDLSWALRIKLYNKYIQGNAERLSVCSDDTHTDDEDCALQSPISQSNFSRKPSHKSNVLAIADCSNIDDSMSPPSKYKSSLLNRYLNDSLRHMIAAKAEGISSARKIRSHSASYDCDQDVVSPASSSETEANFVYHMDAMDWTLTERDRIHQQDRGKPGRDCQGWKEIRAAVALTSLAQGQSGAPMPGASSSEAWRSAVRTRVCSTGAASALQQTEGTTLTSRIIQKSSHISEVQTVKVSSCG
uniref:Mohawk homeobox b n=1 Tax=Oryzias melastigma TaxID=30732 RepID=A0A3B3D7D3_ORYME